MIHNEESPYKTQKERKSKKSPQNEVASKSTGVEEPCQKRVQKPIKRNKPKT